MLSLLFNQGSDVNVNAAGVSANAAIGAGQIDVTFALTGVAASAAIGAGTIDVTFALTGVAASAAIGSGSIDVTFSLTGVAANSAIGTGSVAIDFIASGVSGSAGIGSGSIDVDLGRTGVSGAAAIGTGTLQGAIDIIQGCTLAAATVLLGAVMSRRGKDSGVAAKAGTGVGRVLVDVEIANQRQNIPKLFASRRCDGRIICDVVFSSPGCRTPGRAGNGRVICDVVLRQTRTAEAKSQIGRGKIISIVDLTDDEICALLAMAA